MLLQRATLSLFGVLFAILIPKAHGQAVKNSLTLIESWKALDFTFTYPQDRQKAIQSGEFIQKNILLSDLDIYYKRKDGPRVIFLAIPRLLPGTPITFGSVTDLKSPEGNPLIAPYPNLRYNKIGDCDAITSAEKTQIDHCGRLWVVDSGILMNKQICPPQLLSFSAEDGSLLLRYKFPRVDYKETSYFSTVVIDARGAQCEDTFAYVGDLRGFAIIVYDHNKKRSWRVEDKYFQPERMYGTIVIKGVKIERMDGILGMALSSPNPNGEENLYFHALASRSESYIPTSILRNESLFYNNPGAAPDAVVRFAKKRSSQSGSEAIDKNDVLYFGLVEEEAIGCWASRKADYGENSIEKIVVDPEAMDTPVAMKVIQGKNGSEEFWVLSYPYEQFVAGTMNLQKTNFRIQTGDTDKLIRGTKCDSAH